MWALLSLLPLSLAVAPPRFPDTFTQGFNEILSYPVLGNHTTSGTFHYDWTTQRYRIDRDNGRYDRYCGLNGFKALIDTPCSQIVVNGDRYIYYPEKSECCYCCSADHGCGILKPNWMDTATYLGLDSFDGVPAHKWYNPGLQHNYYYETVADEPSDRVLLAIHQLTNDFQNFKNDRTLTVDHSKLELPSICDKKNTCSFASTCTALRNGKMA